jgi:hypothetical protein
MIRWSRRVNSINGKPQLVVELRGRDRARVVSHFCAQKREKPVLPGRRAGCRDDGVDARLGRQRPQTSQ